MIQHSIKLFFRNIVRYKSTFIINVLGLSTGLACAIIISLWVTDEYAMDQFHENNEELYQVFNRWDRAEGIKILEWTPDMLAETMAEQLPEVKYACASTAPSWHGKVPFTIEGKTVKAEGLFGGEDYFKVFSYPLLQGNENTVLTSPTSLAISENLAKSLFGSVEKAMGKTVEWSALNNTASNQITAVFANTTSNSTVNFDFVLPFQNFITSAEAMGRASTWTNNAPSTYIVLEKGTDAEAFAQKIEGFSKAQNEFVEADLYLKLYSSNYLYGKFENGQVSGGRIDYTYLFMAIALFTLIIACINFMNLSTANATRRLKEIGVKKAVGSSRTTIVWQYFGESILTVGISFGLSLLWVLMVLPSFNELTGKSLTLLFSPITVGVAIVLVLFTGLLAGSYPALYLSNFKPVTILKGKFRSSLNEVRVRKVLVIFQFSLSIILIVSVVVIYNQIEFIQAQNTGIDKDHVVYFPKDGKLQQDSESFLAQINTLPGVKNACEAVQTIIGSETNMTPDVSWPGKEDGGDFDFHTLGVRHGLIETLDLELAEGRAFSKEFATDLEGVIFNETAIAAMGLEDPVGKTVQLWGTPKQIIGVVKDFHFQSFRKSVGPTLFHMANENLASLMLIQLESGNETATLSKIEEVYAEMNPGFTLDYSFLDEDFQKIYSSDKIIAVLAKYFAGLAIIISCLGLFGLAAFSAERRKKEISIRKVHGQSSMQITSMLTFEFIILVGIALVIASPIAYLISNKWLSEFAYKINLSMGSFIIVALLTIVLAVLTISSQTLRAAFQNPTEGLKEN
ncbi:MAG: ABC transporter permease [Flavobacteriales bacterium]